MSEDTPIPEAPFEEQGEPGPGKPGLFADPVVRVMVYVLIGLVILALATVIGVLVTGVLTTTGPRSAAEQRILEASTQAAGAGDAAAPYVNALIAAGDLPAARLALTQARASVSGTGSAPGLDLAEARLFSADKDYANTVTLADKAMKGYQAAYDARVATDSPNAAAAKSAGYGPDYDNAALVKGYALVKLSRWQDAVAAFDIFMKSNPTASDVLIDRGNAKVELNDKAGAEKDFRAALIFVPYDEDAKAGLKKIGITQ
jgi:Flp pilus assembly protein TadD